MLRSEVSGRCAVNNSWCVYGAKGEPSNETSLDWPSELLIVPYRTTVQYCTVLYSLPCGCVWSMLNSLSFVHSPSGRGADGNAGKHATEAEVGVDNITFSDGRPIHEGIT